MHSRSQHLQDMNCNHIIQRFYQFWYRNLICCVFRQDQKNILFRYGRTQVSKVCRKFWYPSFLQCLLYGKPEALYHYNAGNITSYQIRQYNELPDKAIVPERLSYNAFNDSPFKLQR